MSDHPDDALDPLGASKHYRRVVELPSGEECVFVWQEYDDGGRYMPPPSESVSGSDVRWLQFKFSSDPTWLRTLKSAGKLPGARSRDTPAEPWNSSTVRAERRLATAGRLLPPAVRDRQIREWLDHLACEREEGRDPQRALRSILLRSVVPIAISARARRIGHVLLARPR